jgi:subtilase family serine protease
VCDVLIETAAVHSTGAHPAYAGWSASDLEKAYDLPSNAKGSGQTVAVVDAYDNPDVASDFVQYRSTMGLPAGTLNKYNQDGQMGNYPEGSPDWGVEIDLDVEMVSASCPNCTIDLVEAKSNQWTDIETAEAQAVTLGATIVSNSFEGEGASESYYDTPGVTYVASSGDGGAGLYDPATFDSVVAVGGTMLQTARNKRGYTETLWPDSGGGCSSTDEEEPPWQHEAACTPYRIGNDVSAVAVDAAEYDTFDEGGWITVDGASISSPFIAGIFALAGNSTRQDGGRTFWNPSHHKFLYKLGGGYAEAGGWGSPHGIGAF